VSMQGCERWCCVAVALKLWVGAEGGCRSKEMTVWPTLPPALLSQTLHFPALPALPCLLSRLTSSLIGSPSDHHPFCWW